MHSPTASTTPSSKRTQWSEHRVSPELKIIQQQVGHSWASTTAVYTQVGADAKNQMLRAALNAAFGAESSPG